MVECSLPHNCETFFVEVDIKPPPLQSNPIQSLDEATRRRASGKVDHACKSLFTVYLPLRSDRGRFSRLLFFSSLSLLLFVFFGCSDGMEREACVCDHGYERSDLCAEIIIIMYFIREKFEEK